MRGEYKVQQDYAVPRLNGKDAVVWVKGDVVELDADDAEWVNRDREGTLKAAAKAAPKGQAAKAGD